MDKINFKDASKKIENIYEYNLLSKLNDHTFTMVKVENRVLDFHTHRDSDEAFYIIEGKMKIELENKIVELNEGDMFVVKKGISHRPICEGFVTCLLIEKVGTLTAENSPGTHKNNIS